MSDITQDFHTYVEIKNGSGWTCHRTFVLGRRKPNLHWFQTTKRPEGLSHKPMEKSVIPREFRIQVRDWFAFQDQNLINGAQGFYEPPASCKAALGSDHSASPKEMAQASLYRLARLLTDAVVWFEASLPEVIKTRPSYWSIGEQIRHSHELAVKSLSAITEAITQSDGHTTLGRLIHDLQLLQLIVVRTADGRLILPMLAEDKSEVTSSEGGAS